MLDGWSLSFETNVSSPWKYRSLSEIRIRGMWYNAVGPLESLLSLLSGPRVGTQGPPHRRALYLQRSRVRNDLNREKTLYGALSSIGYTAVRLAVRRGGFSEFFSSV